VNDLVGIPAQNELPRIAQRCQDQIELDIGEILNLIHHYEIILGAHPIQVVMADDIRVIEALLIEEAQIPFEKIIDLRALFLSEDGLLDAQFQILPPTQPRLFAHGAGDDTANLLVNLLRILLAFFALLTSKPGLEIAHRHFPALRNLDGFQ